MTILSKITRFGLIVILAAWMIGARGAAAATLEDELRNLQELVRQLQLQVAALQTQIRQAGVAQQISGQAGATPSAYRFERDLGYGATGEDVTQLQNFLTAEGLYDGPITGIFGPLTKAAVARFQEKYAAEILQPHGLLSGTGFAGPSTRNKLNVLRPFDKTQGGQGSRSGPEALQGRTAGPTALLGAKTGAEETLTPPRYSRSLVGSDPTMMRFNVSFGSASIPACAANGYWALDIYGDNPSEEMITATFPVSENSKTISPNLPAGASYKRVDLLFSPTAPLTAENLGCKFHILEGSEAFNNIIFSVQ